MPVLSCEESSPVRSSSSGKLVVSRTVSAVRFQYPKIIRREKQTVGDYAKWHPHIHALVADGLFTESGYFNMIPKVDLRPLAELFWVSVLKMMQKEGRIDDSYIKSWSSTISATD